MSYANYSFLHFYVLASMEMIFTIPSSFIFGTSTVTIIFLLFICDIYYDIFMIFTRLTYICPVLLTATTAPLLYRFFRIYTRDISVVSILNILL